MDRATLNCVVMILAAGAGAIDRRRTGFVAANRTSKDDIMNQRAECPSDRRSVVGFKFGDGRGCGAEDSVSAALNVF